MAPDIELIFFFFKDKSDICQLVVCVCLHDEERREEEAGCKKTGDFLLILPWMWRRVNSEMQMVLCAPRVPSTLRSACEESRPALPGLSGTCRYPSHPQHPRHSIKQPLAEKRRNCFFLINIVSRIQTNFTKHDSSGFQLYTLQAPFLPVYTHPIPCWQNIFLTSGLRSSLNIQLRLHSNKEKKTNYK